MTANSPDLFDTSTTNHETQSSPNSEEGESVRQDSSDTSFYTDRPDVGDYVSV